MNWAQARLGFKQPNLNIVMLDPRPRSCDQFTSYVHNSKYIKFWNDQKTRKRKATNRGVRPAYIRGNRTNITVPYLPVDIPMLRWNSFFKPSQHRGVCINVCLFVINFVILFSMCFDGYTSGLVPAIRIGLINLEISKASDCVLYDIL